MANITCGSCKGKHDTVQAVKLCYAMWAVEDFDGEDPFDYGDALDRAQDRYDRSVYGA